MKALGKRLIGIATMGLVTALLPESAHAQAPSGSETVIPLYPKGAFAPLGVPESQSRLDPTGETMIFNVSNPTLELFAPTTGTANGTAVIIAPGGGFVGLSYGAGGTDVARRLTQHGVTALVLKYRTIQSPDDATIAVTH